MAIFPFPVAVSPDTAQANLRRTAAGNEIQIQQRNVDGTAKRRDRFSPIRIDPGLNENIQKKASRPPMYSLHRGCAAAQRRGAQAPAETAHAQMEGGEGTSPGD